MFNFYRLVTGLLLLSSAGLLSATQELDRWTVKPVDMPKIITFDGEIEALHQATVAAQTSGRITEVVYDVGDYVSAGSVIAKLTSIEQAAQLDAALGQQKETQAMASEAEKAYQRSASMLAKKLISQAEFDSAQARLKTIQAKAKSAAAAVTSAQANLAYTTITAPYAGIVVERLVQPGETVNPGTPIMTGVSLQELRVNVPIPQRHIGPVRQFQQATILLPNGNTLPASSMRIPPRADTNTHSFKVLIDLSGEHDNLFPGTLVKVQFVNGNQQRLAVPDNAIVKRGEVTAVYVLGQADSISLRYVRLGEQFNGQTAILAGLSAGETIVLNPILAAQAYKLQQHQEPTQ